jgi:RNAse (barnase) inhibitor barstar
LAKTLTILGSNIRDIPSFYAEINRVFMTEEDWALGHSLDGFDDMLHGGYGAIAGQEPVTLVWRGFDGSRSALGVETTRAILHEKLQRPDLFDTARICRQLAELEQGTGPTYFDIILGIIADHRNIELVIA